ncbi:trehalose-phosphatase [Yonghaparkia sp. Root332]|uniref:trehalose-phosphatase n=1 Tax=Yonghaparkia sp. Root332 TaxID=1736516 RepID=UPI0009E89432|nr:trehalose-phosphatase [Yonghaparkia sp. Root332]
MGDRSAVAGSAAGRDLDQNLDPDLISALERVAEAPTLLIALDFDGTLAPLVDDPDDSRALPAARTALDALGALPGTIVALVSGRSLESLARVAEAPDDQPLVGSHGLEVRFAAADARPAVDDADAARVAALRSRLEPLVAAVPGAWIEPKPAGLAVHSRRVDDPDAVGALVEAVHAEAVAVDDALTVRDGRDVVEFAVRDATKGDGLRALVERFAPDAVLFAGDDVTDEDALAVLGPRDLGIKVGEAASSARARVADPEQLAVALAHLLRSRESFSGDAR